MTTALNAMALILLGALSCSTAPAPAPASQGSALPNGIVARVGAVEIPLDRVVSVASARGISTSAARELMIQDALFAQAALADGFDAEPATRAALRGCMARAALAEESKRATADAPTDLEVEAGTQRHFEELDRPESFRVVHAVALLAKADAAKRARVRAVAERLARAVAGASSAVDFREKAEHAPHDDVDVKVEELKPVTADGRVIETDPKVRAAQSEPGRYAKTFAHAAAQLVRPGDQSPVVETDFGFHVLMLLERLPAITVPLEERRRMLADEIYAERARKAIEARTQQLRHDRPPLVERSADTLTASVGPRSP